ncbi:MAG: hypothetical protein ACTHJ8_09940 [Mucilaginibacter sp.]
MKTFIWLFLLSCIATIFNSCSNHVYAPALFQQDIAYQPKPTSFDTAKTANYFSAGLDYYTDPTWQNMLVSAQFNLSRGHVFHNVNLAYGVFGVLGDYDKGSSSSDLPAEKFTDKFFGAVGARASANLFTTYDRMDFRYLGVEAAYSDEFGDYANFRKSVSNQPAYHIDPRTQLVTVGLTSEVIFHNEHNINIQNGIRFFIGRTLGDNSFNQQYLGHNDIEPQFFNTFFPKMSYYLKVKNFIATVEAGKQIFIRAGVSF